MKIAFYGTLMRGFEAQARLGVEALLDYVGPCRIPGLLWDLGAYPGLTPGDGDVAGELFQVLDEAVLAVLDAFEGPNYERRRIELAGPAGSAWVYYFTASVEGRPPVPSSSWRIHTEASVKAGGPRSS